MTDRDLRGLTYDLESYQAEVNTFIKFAKIDSQIGKDDTAFGTSGKNQCISI